VFGAIYRQHETSMSKSFRQMGGSWLAAARAIESAVPEEKREAFNKACQDWHASFYEPRIRQDAKPQAVRAPSAQAESDNGDAEEGAWPPSPTCLAMRIDESAGFSVIVPVYNHYRYLRECLTGILAQETRNPLEIILANDASSDARVAPLLEAFAKQCPNIKLLTNSTNLGIAETQNRAARAAASEFLVFVDCDDALPPGALAEVEKALELETDYLFTDRTDINAAGKRIRIAQYGGYERIKPSGDIAADLLDGMVASHLKVIRRQKLLEAGGFDSRFGGVQDWEVALKLAQAGARFQYLPRPLYLHRLHGGSVTGADSVRQFWLSNRVRRGFASAALRPNVDDESAIRAAKRALASAAPAVETFRNLHLSGTAALKQAWRKGRICAYAMNEDASIEEVNALREFNSYFDAVFAPSEATASAMIGYMWDHAALVLDGELAIGEAQPRLRA
jgi:glycosyltransferase involved in cell wall biosynthesis